MRKEAHDASFLGPVNGQRVDEKSTEGMLDLVFLEPHFEQRSQNKLLMDLPCHGIDSFSFFSVMLEFVNSVMFG